MHVMNKSFSFPNKSIYFRSFQNAASGIEVSVLFAPFARDIYRAGAYFLLRTIVHRGRVFLYHCTEVLYD